MGIQRVIIHAGFHKTGTSSIQETLYNEGVNQELLQEKGILYLREWSFYRNGDQSLIFLNMCAPNLEDTKKINDAVSADLAEINRLTTMLKETIFQYEKKGSFHTLLFSAEEISSLDENAIYELKHFFEQSLGKVEFRVLLSTRNFVDAHVALRQTSIGIGFFVEKDYDLLPNDNILYRTCIQRMEKNFGAENITVYSFEDALKKGGPVEYFLSILGFSDDEIAQFTIFRARPSYSYESVELLRALFEAVPQYIFTPEGEIYNDLRNQLHVQQMREIVGEKFNYSPADRAKIVPFYMEDALWLRDTYGINYVDAMQKYLEGASDHTSHVLTVTDSVIKSLARLDLKTQRFLLQVTEKQYAENQSRFFTQVASALKDIIALSEEFIKIDPENENKVDWHTSSKDVMVAWDNKDALGNTVRKQMRFQLTAPHIELHADIDPEENVKELYILPTYTAVLVRVESLSVNGKQDGFSVGAYNCALQNGMFFIFLKKWPHIVIRADKPIQTVHAKLFVEKCRMPFPSVKYEYLLSVDHVKELKQLEEIAAKNREIEELRGALRDKTQELEIMEMRYNERFFKKILRYFHSRKSGK